MGYIYIDSIFSTYVNTVHWLKLNSLTHNSLEEWNEPINI